MRKEQFPDLDVVHARPEWVVRPAWVGWAARSRPVRAACLRRPREDASRPRGV